MAHSSPTPAASHWSDPRDADHDRLRAHYDVGTVVGIAMLVSHYVATARTLDAVDVEPETAFVGWTP